MAPPPPLPAGPAPDLRWLPLTCAQPQKQHEGPRDTRIAGELRSRPTAGAMVTPTCGPFSPRRDMHALTRGAVGATGVAGRRPSFRPRAQGAPWEPSETWLPGPGRKGLGTKPTGRATVLMAGATDSTVQVESHPRAGTLQSLQLAHSHPGRGHHEGPASPHGHPLQAEKAGIRSYSLLLRRWTAGHHRTRAVHPLTSTTERDAHHCQDTTGPQGQHTPAETSVLFKG